MQHLKQLPRALLFITLLTGLLGGMIAPVLHRSAQAAPVFQSFAACPGPTIAQWTFTGSVTSPSSGTGTFAQGSGVTGPTYQTGQASSEDPSISFTSFDTVGLDTTAYLEFEVDTMGRAAIVVNFKYRVSNTGPTNLEVYYSSDGITFSPFGSPTTLINDSNWYTLNFNLSSVSALNNNSNVTFRFYGYSASSATDTWSLDNVTFSGTCLPIISEVAWAGTQASIDDEWMELYNPALTSSDISGWRLVTNSGSLDIIFPSGTIIPATGFLLLERAHYGVTDAPLPSQINMTYFGSLANTGEILRLRKPDGTIVDTANQDGGTWPAGSTSNFASMERIMNAGVISPDDANGWMTYANPPGPASDAGSNLIYGTPGDANWAFTVTATPTSTSTPTLTPSPTITPSPTRTLTSTPAATLALLINEVAWAGTIASANDEWIELYNPGLISINLDGWKLTTTSNSLNVTLSGTINAGSYFLLERTEDTVIPTIHASQIYTGSLSDNGEILRLIDSTSRTVDTANSDSGAWPAGCISSVRGNQPCTVSSNTASMERRGLITDGFFAWSTYANTSPPPYPNPLVYDRDGNKVYGTPGQVNWGPIVTLTPTATRTRVPTSTPLRKATSTPAPLVGRMIINEYLPRAGFDWNQDSLINVQDEFIEIKNLGPVVVTLNGWKLDDEADQSSAPFSIPSMTVKPGQRVIFYGSTTGILLSDGGDTVRLLNSSGKVIDAHTYSIAEEADRSWCRFPDSINNIYWNKNCLPTPGLENKLIGEVPSEPPGTGLEVPLCQLPDTLLPDYLLAECSTSFGEGIWRPMYWDEGGWLSQYPIYDDKSKWLSFVE